MDLYEIYCITEGSFIPKYSKIPLVSCPNDELHEVNPQSACIKEATSGNVIFSSSRIIKISDVDYRLAYTITSKPMSQIKLISSGSYYIRISNYDKKEVLLETLITQKLTLLDCLILETGDLIEIDVKIHNVEKAQIKEIIITT